MFLQLRYMNIKFMHKTVRDYLVETQNGREKLLLGQQEDKDGTFSELYVAKYVGLIVRAVLSAILVGAYDFDSFGWVFQAIKRRSDGTKCLNERKEFNDLLSDCQSALESLRTIVHRSNWDSLSPSSPYHGGNLESIAIVNYVVGAAYNDLKPLVAGFFERESKKRQIATEFLSYLLFHFLGWHGSEHPVNNDMLDCFLRYGSDPNCLVDSIGPASSRPITLFHDYLLRAQLNRSEPFSFLGSVSTFLRLSAKFTLFEHIYLQVRNNRGRDLYSHRGTQYATFITHILRKDTKRFSSNRRASTTESLRPRNPGF